MGRVLPQQESELGPKSASVRRLDERLPEYGRDVEIAASLGISVESYWRRSEAEQAFHEARWHESRERCIHCGQPVSECSDPDKLWYPQREICYATRERAAADAAYARIHQERQWTNTDFSKWVEKPSPEYPYKYDMGVTIGVLSTDRNPTDLFTTRECAPWPPPTPEEVEDGHQA